MRVSPGLLWMAATAVTVVAVPGHSARMNMFPVKVSVLYRLAYFIFFLPIILKQLPERPQAQGTIFVDIVL